MTRYAHKRWSIGPFARGAYGSPDGGHVSILGVQRSWVKWSSLTSWEFFRLVYIEWSDYGTRFGVASIEVKFRPAVWRAKTVRAQYKGNA